VLGLNSLEKEEEKRKKKKKKEQKRIEETRADQRETE